MSTYDRCTCWIDLNMIIKVVLSIPWGLRTDQGSVVFTRNNFVNVFFVLIFKLKIKVIGNHDLRVRVDRTYTSCAYSWKINSGSYFTLLSTWTISLKRNRFQLNGGSNLWMNNSSRVIFLTIKSIPWSFLWVFCVWVFC